MLADLSRSLLTLTHTHFHYIIYSDWEGVEVHISLVVLKNLQGHAFHCRPAPPTKFFFFILPLITYNGVMLPQLGPRGSRFYVLIMIMSLKVSLLILFADTPHTRPERQIEGFLSLESGQLHSSILV